MIDFTGAPAPRAEVVVNAAAQGDLRPPSAAAGRRLLAVLAGLALLAAGCTQESQNKISRSIQNWTGTDGVLEIYAGNTLVKRFMKIDKLSTAMGTSDGLPRSYRYGYGVLDANLNGVADPDERKVYFEISDYATFYVFYENPK
ncbi:MAG: hypothetical protein R3E83_06900 [Burkholderiaceae bacterium]